MSHTVTITKLPDEETDDTEFTIGGTCGHYCIAWTECRRTRCQKDPERVGYDERDVHGVEHMYIDGVWMVSTGKCALKVMDWSDENICDLKELGTFALDVEWDGDWWIVSPGPRVDA